MTHNDIYTKFMIEYDKANITSSYPSLTKSASATILDKAYLAHLAQKVTGNNQRKVGFEADVKAIEDLRPLIVNKVIDQSSKTYRYADNDFIYKIPDDLLYYVDAKLIRSIYSESNALDLKSHRIENVNLIDHRFSAKFLATDNNMPWIPVPVLFMDSDMMHVLVDTYKLQKDLDEQLKLTYIKKPAKFVDSLTSGSDNNTDTEDSGESTTVTTYVTYITGPSNVTDNAQYSAKSVSTDGTTSSVTFSIVDGSEYASITSNGYLTVKDGANNSSVTIKATSVSHPEISEEKTITVTKTITVPYSISDISGKDSIYDKSNSAVYTATCNKGTILWTITTGSNYASIDKYSGELDVYSNANYNDIIIKAYIAEDVNVYSNKKVNVKYYPTSESSKIIHYISSISPSVSSITNTATFTANAYNSTGQTEGVIWSIEEGSEYASINNGVVTVKEGANNDFVCIKAANAIDQSKFNEKIIKVTYSSLFNLDDYVDLYLPSGKLWSKYNLGADEEGEVGDGYQWGQLTPGTNATYESYADTYNSWCEDSDDGYPTSANTYRCLTNEHDVCYQTFKNNVHTASWNDYIELMYHTNMSLVTLNGKQVVKVSAVLDPTRYVYFPIATYWTNTDATKVFKDLEWQAYITEFKNSKLGTTDINKDGTGGTDYYTKITYSKKQVKYYYIRPVLDVTNVVEDIDGLDQSISASGTTQYVDLGLASGTLWADRNIGAAYANTYSPAANVDHWGTLFTKDALTQYSNAANMLEWIELFATCYGQLLNDDTVLLTGLTGKRIKLPWARLTTDGTEFFTNSSPLYMMSDDVIDNSKLSIYPTPDDSIYSHVQHSSEYGSVNDFIFRSAFATENKDIFAGLFCSKAEDQNGTYMIDIVGTNSVKGAMSQAREVKSHTNKFTSAKLITEISQGYYYNEATIPNIYFEVWSYDPDISYKYLTSNITLGRTERLLMEVKTLNGKMMYHWSLQAFIRDVKDDFKLYLVVNGNDTCYGKISNEITIDDARTA